MNIDGTTATFDHIMLKTKTAAQWTADNTTVLKAGEMGIESNTGKFKFGNGESKWGALPYATMTIAEINAAIESSGGGSSVEVIDNLESYSSTAALSANQGRDLNESKQDNLANVSRVYHCNQTTDYIFLLRNGTFVKMLLQDFLADVIPSIPDNILLYDYSPGC